MSDTPFEMWKKEYTWIKESVSDESKACWRGIAKMDAAAAYYYRRAIRAEQRAESQVAQLTRERDDLATDYVILRKERDAARYEATMEAARMVADEAAKYDHIKGSTRNKYDAFCYSVLCELWSRVSGVKLT